MAKRIIWSDPARDELKSIIKFWNKKTQSKSYSSRIRSNIKGLHKILKINPLIGEKTNYKKIRSKTLMKHFQVIYKIEEEQIIILNFWDSRQNPDDNPYM